MGHINEGARLATDLPHSKKARMQQVADLSNCKALTIPSPKASSCASVSADITAGCQTGRDIKNLMYCKSHVISYSIGSRDLNSLRYHLAGLTHH